jgi:serine/threonine protein kinase
VGIEACSIRCNYNFFCMSLAKGCLVAISRAGLTSLPYPGQLFAQLPGHFPPCRLRRYALTERVLTYALRHLVQRRTLSPSHHCSCANVHVLCLNIDVMLQLSVPACVQLCDFGYSKHEQFHSAPGSRVGTPAYLAPEIVKVSQGSKYNGKVRGPRSRHMSLSGEDVVWQDSRVHQSKQPLTVRR